jgi:hypothetical protein
MKVDLKRLDSSALMFTVIGVLAVSFVLMAGTFFVVARDAGYDEQYLKLVTNLRLGAQQVTQHSLARGKWHRRRLQKSRTNPHRFSTKP